MNKNYGNSVDPPSTGNYSKPPMRALDERRIDPGTVQRRNIDTPSPLSNQIPRGRDNTKAPGREGAKR